MIAYALLIIVFLCAPAAAQDIVLRGLGEQVTFAWEWTPQIGCASCDKTCGNCQSNGQIEIPIGSETVKCGDTTFQLDWNWPQVTVTGGCKGPMVYTYRYKFRGIRAADGSIVFEGETEQPQTSIDFVFGEAKVVLEVAAIVTSSGVTNTSKWSRSTEYGSPQPWIVSAVINEPTNFLFKEILK